MIASLRGKLLRLDLQTLLLETGGVGYEVQIPFPVHLALKDAVNLEVFLYIFHSITERGQKLFGFLQPKDRDLFLLIKSMHGIGEATALKILSFYGADELKEITCNEDKAKLEKIPKVKGKTSEKILFELKQNIHKLESFLVAPDKETKEAKGSRVAELATLALVQLGFEEKVATRAISEIHVKNPELSPGELVKLAITRN